MRTSFPDKCKRRKLEKGWVGWVLENKQKLPDDAMRDVMAANVQGDDVTPSYPCCYSLRVKHILKQNAALHKEKQQN